MTNDQSKEVVFEPYIRVKRGKNLCMECAGVEYNVG